MQENYFEREEVYIIGVSCEGSGVLDERKLCDAAKGNPPTAVAFDGDDFRVHHRAGRAAHPGARSDGGPLPRMPRTPSPRSTTSRSARQDRSAHWKRRSPRSTRFEAQDGSERWKFWEHQFDRCIRCFACRSVCPMCYCDECVVDSTSFSVTGQTTAEEKANRVRWIERSATRPRTSCYHMTRGLHLAGRCIDCNECERVCPVNIPLRLLNNKMEREAREQFGYEPGASIGGPSLTASFLDTDPGDFIR